MQLSLNSNPMRLLMFALLIQLAAAKPMDGNHTVNDGEELRSSQNDSLLANRTQRWWYPNHLDRPPLNPLHRLPLNPLHQLPVNPLHQLPPNWLDGLHMPDFYSSAFCKDQMASVACYVKKCVYELIDCMHRLCDDMEPCRQQHVLCTKRCFNSNEGPFNNYQQLSTPPMSGFEGHQSTGLPFWGSTEDGLMIFERLSSVYNRHFNPTDPEWVNSIPGLGPPHYQMYVLVPPVAQAVSYIFDVLGPQNAGWLEDDYDAFITVGVLNSALMKLSIGIAVFRSASRWPKLPPDARSYAEGRAKEEDELGQFLRQFLALANDLRSLEMDELEIQLCHATMATCNQWQSVGCCRLSGVCLCSSEVVLNCEDVRDAAVYHMRKTRHLPDMDRWDVIEAKMNLAFEMVQGSGRRILQLPLLNQHDLAIDPKDTHLLYVLFRHDLQSQLSNIKIY